VTIYFRLKAVRLLVRLLARINPATRVGDRIVE
jgi:hypothetical protein